MKLCHDRAVNKPWNRCIKRVPNDMLIKVSTAMSSTKRVVFDRVTHLTEVDLAVAHSSVVQPTNPKNAKLMSRAIASYGARTFRR